MATWPEATARPVRKQTMPAKREHARRPLERELFFQLIDRDRKNQDDKFPPSAPDSHLPKADEANDAKLRVLLEEVGEVAKVLNERAHRGPGSDLDEDERRELHKE